MPTKLHFLPLEAQAFNVGRPVDSFSTGRQERIGYQRQFDAAS